jgi:hypothetical protein
MISVIICSANPADLLLIKENIQSTIGVPYEIIAFDNSLAKRSLCDIYNKGVERAAFSILCFMHEDLKIATYEWGKVVIDIFIGNGDIGVIGVAGGGYKALTPSGWYAEEFQHAAKSFQNIIQGFKDESRDEIHAFDNPYRERVSEVITVDGVWFCTKREIARDHLFDEVLLKGFHGYDLDFCLSVYGKHKIVVTYDILMTHQSEGVFDKKWLDTILLVHQKWSGILPLTTADVPESEIYYTEKRSLKRLITKMIEWGYSFGEIHKMLAGVSQSRKLSIRLFFKGYKHFLVQWLGKSVSAE